MHLEGKVNRIAEGVSLWPEGRCEERFPALESLKRTNSHHSFYCVCVHVRVWPVCVHMPMPVHVCRGQRRMLTSLFFYSPLCSFETKFLTELGVTLTASKHCDVPIPTPGCCCIAIHSSFFFSEFLWIQFFYLFIFY